MDKKHLDTTLVIAQAMTDELTDYVMGDSLYRQMVVKTPSGTRQPKMTLGALLENLELLSSEKSALSAAQQAALSAIEQQVDVSRNAFAERWQAHLRRELKSLLDSWKWYLDEAGAKQEARESYASEAHIRTRIDVVMRALSADPGIAGSRNELSVLDARLRGLLQGGAYVGPHDEKGHYPPSKAWWLYGGMADW